MQRGTSSRCGNRAKPGRGRPLRTKTRSLAPSYLIKPLACLSERAPCGFGGCTIVAQLLPNKGFLPRIGFSHPNVTHWLRTTGGGIGQFAKPLWMPAAPSGAAKLSAAWLSWNFKDALRSRDYHSWLRVFLSCIYPTPEHRTRRRVNGKESYASADSWL